MIGKDRLRRARVANGFTLFEALVAMFILLVGLLGIITVFSAGIQARLVAQEIVISQELANMWADWIRFRLNDSPSAGAPANVLSLSALATGAQGDFFGDTGNFHAAPGNTLNLPTYKRNVYRGYVWEITAVESNYRPEWLAEDGTARPIGARLDGGAMPFGSLDAMKEIELTISRGARRYRYNYLFSGVGMKYGKL